MIQRIQSRLTRVTKRFSWATDSSGWVLFFLILFVCITFLTAWRTEQAVCFVLQIRHTAGTVYVLLGLSAIAVLMHEAEFVWKWEWIKLPIGSISIAFLYYCSLSMLWLVISVLFQLDEKVSDFGTLAVMVLSCSLAAIGYVNTGRLRVVSYQIPLAYMEGQYRIALISDLHLGAFVRSKHVKKIVDAINDISPDMVIVAGDLIDDDQSIFQDPVQIDRIAYEFRRIRSQDGVILTLGNHDPVAADDCFSSFLTACNIRLLHNEVIDHPRFYLLGRSDQTHNYRMPANKLLADMIRTKPLIVADHNPKYIDEAVGCGADLVLSGHTHAGQFFPATLIAKYVVGKDRFYGYQAIQNTHVVISSGAGVFNLPVRIGTYNEVVEVILGNGNVADGICHHTEGKH